MCLILSGIAKLAEHWVNRSPKVIEAKKTIAQAELAGQKADIGRRM
jgi:hypothetical protein